MEPVKEPELWADGVLTVGGACEFLSVCRTQFNKLARKYAFPFRYADGTRRVFAKRPIVEWLNSLPSEPNPETAARWKKNTKRATSTRQKTT